MELIEYVLTILEGGSDAALIAIAVAIWRLDRRVLKLEIKLEGAENA